MKRIIIALLVCFVLCCIITPCSFAETKITFAWSQLSVPDLAGFNMYQREDPNDYNYTVPVATINDPNARTYELQDVPDGKNLYWVLRSFDKDGIESDNSNEVNQNQTGAPPTPGSFRIQSIIKIDNITVPVP